MVQILALCQALSRSILVLNVHLTIELAGRCPFESCLDEHPAAHTLYRPLQALYKPLWVIFTPADGKIGSTHNHFVPLLPTKSDSLTLNVEERARNFLDL
jgi:hypothetical protein